MAGGQIANSCRESASLWDIPNNRDMNHERLAQGSRSMPCLLLNNKFVNLGERVLIINEMVHNIYNTVISISFDYEKRILVKFKYIYLAYRDNHPIH